MLDDTTSVRFWRRCCSIAGCRTERGLLNQRLPWSLLLFIVIFRRLKRRQYATQHSFKLELRRRHIYRSNHYSKCFLFYAGGPCGLYGCTIFAHFLNWKMRLKHDASVVQSNQYTEAPAHSFPMVGKKPCRAIIFVRAWALFSTFDIQGNAETSLRF